MRMICATMFIGVLLCGPLASGQTQDGGLPRRPALGVAIGPNDRGVAVTSVAPGSAAAADGLRAGDVITDVDGAVVHTPADVVAALVRHRAGEIARFTIVRDNRSESHAVTLGPFPRESQPGVTLEYGAVTLRDGSRLRTIVSVPAEGATRQPAVMLIQGGACNSIEVPPGAAENAGPGGLMRTLAVRGYVTLRVEKSGVGDSTGPPCDAIGYQQELEGYRLALAALKRHSRVDAGRVVLFGLSLGGVFAPILARADPVRGIVVYGTLAGPPPIYPGRSERFFTEFAGVDVAGAWSAIDAAVLALHGQFDEVASLADHERVAALVNAKHPGRAEARELPGLDHCWTQHATMDESRGHCGEGRPAETAAAAILAFVERLTTRGPR